MRIRDPNPSIPAAGKSIPKGSSARECISPPSERTTTPEKIKYFRGMTQPEPGKQRVFHSFAEDPPTAKEKSHGISTRTSLKASDLANPPSKSLFEHLMQEKVESIYGSKAKAPLGRSHDQSKGLPSGLHPEQTRFGRATIRDDSAGDIVSPQKSVQQVTRESQEGKELYKKSHNDYEVGEMMDRDYDWSKFTKGSLYGVPTPHDNSGSGVKSALHWLHLARSEKAAQLVSKRVDEFRERNQPQLGKVHDPLADTMQVAENHTFGTMIQPDEHGAGNLIHMKAPSSFDECKEFDSGLLSSIRHHLSKNKYYNIEGLLTAFLHLDKDLTGSVPRSAVDDLCFQHNVPLEVDMLDLLTKWCMVEGEMVHWPTFIDLINWKGKLLPTAPLLKEKPPKEGELLTHREDVQNEPEGTSPRQKPSSPSAPETTTSPEKADLRLYQTSSQMINSVVGGVPKSGYHTYGVQTIRSDRPAPRIRRVGDYTNYGDESDAYGLMYPSMYSNRGVYESDFFEPRTPDQIREVFDNIGVNLSDELFQMLWKEAASRDPKGQVSVEAFRSVMEELQAMSNQS